MTGRHHAAALALWLGWLASTAQAQDGTGLAAAAVSGDLADCLQQALLVWQPDPDGDARLLLEFEDGRSQQVFVRSQVVDVAGVAMREVWSVAAPGAAVQDPATLESLLLANSDEEAGCWSLRPLGGSTTLVHRMMVPVECDPGRLRRLIGLSGRAADAMERGLTGSDEF
jgi:hypothetical protein